MTLSLTFAAAPTVPHTLVHLPWGWSAGASGSAQQTEWNRSMTSTGVTEDGLVSFGPLSVRIGSIFKDSCVIAVNQGGLAVALLHFYWTLPGQAAVPVVRPLTLPASFSWTSLTATTSRKVTKVSTLLATAGANGNCVLQWPECHADETYHLDTDDTGQTLRRLSILFSASGLETPTLSLNLGTSGGSGSETASAVALLIIATSCLLVVLLAFATVRKVMSS